MSPSYWERRLGRIGLAFTVYENEVVNDWTVFVTSVDKSRSDKRFSPLIGIGVHMSRDEAMRRAVEDFDEKETELKREQALLALAGERAET